MNKKNSYRENWVKTGGGGSGFHFQFQSVDKFYGGPSTKNIPESTESGMFS